jgi:hypothetical protein
MPALPYQLEPHDYVWLMIDLSHYVPALHSDMRRCDQEGRQDHSNLHHPR